MLIVVVTLILMAGAWRLAGLDEATMSMPKANLRTERVVRAWFAETRSNAIRAVVLIHSDDPELKRRLMPQVEVATRRISEMQQEVESLIGSTRARALFDEVGIRRTRYLELSRTAFEMKQAGQMEEALSLLNTSMLPAVETYIRSIKGLVEHYTHEVERDAASATVIAQSMRNLLIRVCAAGVLLGILFSWWITSSLPEPIRQAVTVGRRVTDGELVVKVQAAAGSSGVGQLLKALSDMTENLRGMVGQSGTGPHRVLDTSDRIAKGIVGLSQHWGRENSLVGFSASRTPDHWVFGGSVCQAGRDPSDDGLDGKSVYFV